MRFDSSKQSLMDSTRLLDISLASPIRFLIDHVHVFHPLRIIYLCIASISGKSYFLHSILYWHSNISLMSFLAYSKCDIISTILSVKLFPNLHCSQIKFNFSENNCCCVHNRSFKSQASYLNSFIQSIPPCNLFIFCWDSWSCSSLVLISFTCWIWRELNYLLIFASAVSLWSSCTYHCASSFSSLSMSS